MGVKRTVNNIGLLMSVSKDYLLIVGRMQDKIGR